MHSKCLNILECARFLIFSYGFFLVRSPFLSICMLYIYASVLFVLGMAN